MTPSIGFRERNIFVRLIGAAFVCGAFFLPYLTQAASLNFSPASGNYKAGQTFTVAITVESSDQSMNAVSGTVTFPDDALEVVSVSKTNSIVNLWVQEPAISQSAGTVKFEGVVLSPGYTGPAGKVVTMTLRAKQAGSASLAFLSSAVLANDGKGTNILAKSGTAAYTIGESQAGVGAAPAENVAPKLASPTHPEQDKWYQSREPHFRWNIGSGTTAVRILYDKFPASAPSVAYDPPISERQLSGLADGIWYFHMQARQAGGWTATEHFRFQIDGMPPESFAVTEQLREDETDPTVVFELMASDAASGVERFDVKIDDKDWEQWNASRGSRYEVVANPGKHTLLARALDKAGNYLEQSAEFEVLPLEKPVVTMYATSVRPGERFTVAGTTKYPNATVELLLQNEQGEIAPYSIPTDGSGAFRYSVEMPKGTYAFSVFVKDGRAARSLNTDPIAFIVKGLDFFGMGATIIKYLSVVVTIIALVLAALMIVLYGWHRLRTMRYANASERNESERAVSRAFATLREEVRAQVATLDDKPNLSVREKRIFERLNEALTISEKYIERKMKRNKV